MLIKTIKIADINPAHYNPRKDLKPEDKEYLKLAKSMKEFDLVEPLVWNKRTGNLVGGHQRLKILKDIGQTEVEVSVVDLTDAKEKALNLALNKISGEWDLPLLKDLLQEIDTGDFDIEITGFDNKEIEDLVNQLHQPTEGLTNDDAVPEHVEPKTKRGDLYKLGNHRLLCGDATVITDVEKLMQGEKADMVFTDPPYGIDLDTDYTDMGDKAKKWQPIKNDDKPFNFQEVILPEIKEQFWFGANYYRKTIPDGGSWFVWDKYPTDQNDKRFGSAFELIWSRQKHQQTVIRIMSLNVGHHKREVLVHPTQKPSDLCCWFIDKFSQADNVIIDLFGGSGSTLIACEKLNRQCRMMEIDEHYVDVIVKRWEDFTGQKAELINGDQES